MRQSTHFLPYFCLLRDRLIPSLLSLSLLSSLLFSFLLFQCMPYRAVGEAEPFCSGHLLCSLSILRSFLLCSFINNLFVHAQSWLMTPLTTMTTASPKGPMNTHILTPVLSGLLSGKSPDAQSQTKRLPMCSTACTTGTFTCAVKASLGILPPELVVFPGR